MTPDATSSDAEQDRTMLLSMFHANPATLEAGIFSTDRKFLVGMQRYARDIPASLITVHPRLLPDERIMDPVSVPFDALPYRVAVVDTDAVWRPAVHEMTRLREVVAASDLVYHGFFNVGPLCSALGVPEVLVAEFDCQTSITSATVDARNPLVKLVRGVRAWRQHQGLMPAVRRALSVHCNGYPVHAELSPLNPHCVLFLDSRMDARDVIAEHRLVRRLAERPGRLRLLYSGRYEHMKGASDVVSVGLACLARGMDIELHLYGQGRQAALMREQAAASKGRIQVHDAVPFPELIEISRGFDVFVCCHVQNDPSCTYLESFGAGLPVVGYGNRMWRGLHSDAGAGVVTPMGDVPAVVDALKAYADDETMLAQHSHAARNFALAHCFEKEFEKRVSDLARCLAECTRTDRASPA